MLWQEVIGLLDFRCYLHVASLSLTPLPDTRTDKSVPYLFSTPQARSQQQTEILIHLLKKLAPVNEISGVLWLVDPTDLKKKIEASGAILLRYFRGKAYYMPWV